MSLLAIQRKGRSTREERERSEKRQMNGTKKGRNNHTGHVIPHPVKTQILNEGTGLLTPISPRVTGHWLLDGSALCTTPLHGETRPS